ncbi:MAG: hypothetical protein JSS27_02625 [Planctomycetes bacterium]|nr:hypothetical protein [Planctomycetota bacterium]
MSEAAPNELRQRNQVIVLANQPQRRQAVASKLKAFLLPNFLLALPTQKKVEQNH